jgi:hypothetical protein
VAHDVCEFRVAGLIGPVSRSALSELGADPGLRSTLFTGRVHEPAGVEDLLRGLAGQGMDATIILISELSGWQRRTPPCPPGTSRPRPGRGLR